MRRVYLVGSRFEKDKKNLNYQKTAVAPHLAVSKVPCAKSLRHSWERQQFPIWSKRRMPMGQKLTKYFLAMFSKPAWVRRRRVRLHLERGLVLGRRVRRWTRSVPREWRPLRLDLTRLSRVSASDKIRVDHGHRHERARRHGWPRVNVQRAVHYGTVSAKVRRWCNQGLWHSNLNLKI